MNSEKSVDQFAKEMRAAGFSFELKAVRLSDGLTLATPGFIEEQDFIKQENMRKKQEGRKWANNLR